MRDRLLAVWITVLACAMPTRIGVAPAAAQRDEAARPRGAVTADGARAMLEGMAPGDGWWVTRNDAYTSAEPAEPDYYATRFERGPTGQRAAASGHLQNRGFTEEGGEWRPRRRYTWVWTPAGGADPPVC